MDVFWDSVLACRVRCLQVLAGKLFMKFRASAAVITDQRVRYYRILLSSRSAVM